VVDFLASKEHVGFFLAVKEGSKEASEDGEEQGDKGGWHREGDDS
jgi:hypothetical protein